MKKQPLAVEKVYDDIKTKIESHYWLPGDRLPSENDLAEQYDVSRITIRTSLQKLGALGLTETQTGGGTYITRFKFSNLMQRVSGSMIKNITHDDICVFREMLETMSIELLKKQKIQSKDIKTLRNYCKHMKKYAHIKDPKGFASTDYEFHLELCRMSGNRMFIYAYEMLGPIMIEYFETHYDVRCKELTDSFDSTVAYNEAVEAHEMIVDYLEQSEFDECIRIIRHIASVDPYKQL